MSDSSRKATQHSASVVYVKRGWGFFGMDTARVAHLAGFTLVDPGERMFVDSTRTVRNAAERAISGAFLAPFNNMNGRDPRTVASGNVTLITV